MKLISMTDFVSNHIHSGCAVEQINKMRKYSEFLKKPLTLGMFIPCGDDGNILDFEVYQGFVIIGTTRDAKKSKIRRGDIYGFRMYEGSKYQQAQERVLFKGYYVNYNSIISPCGGYLDESRLKNKTIESLIGTDIQLTESAIK